MLRFESHAHICKTRWKKNRFIVWVQYLMWRFLVKDNKTHPIDEITCRKDRVPETFVLIDVKHQNKQLLNSYIQLVLCPGIEIVGL